MPWHLASVACNFPVTIENARETGDFCVELAIVQAAPHIPSTSQTLVRKDNRRASRRQKREDFGCWSPPQHSPKTKNLELCQSLACARLSSPPCHRLPCQPRPPAQPKAFGHYTVLRPLALSYLSTASDRLSAVHWLVHRTACSGIELRRFKHSIVALHKRPVAGRAGRCFVSVGIDCYSHGFDPIWQLWRKELCAQWPKKNANELCDHRTSAATLPSQFAMYVPDPVIRLLHLLLLDTRLC